MSKPLWRGLSHQAEFSGFQRRLCAVAHAEFAEDVAEVILDRAARDEERLADLAIGGPMRQQSQDLLFPPSPAQSTAISRSRRRLLEQQAALL